MKRGQSAGFGWIYVILTLFFVGIFTVLLNQVFAVHILPQTQILINQSLLNSTGRTEANLGITQMTSYWNVVPFVIFFVVIIFLILLAVRKGRNEI